MQTYLSRFTLIFCLLATAAGCGDAAGPQRSLGSAAGLYLLASVNGESLPANDPYLPISGSIYLWPTGHAERHVTYRMSDGRSETLESAGSFHFENGALVLELHSTGQYAPDSWSVSGTLDHGKLTIGYPGAADGEIIEEYHKR